MSFFLIGKGPDGSLTLLSDRTFESRADAMAELSRITADPDFGHWDNEVVVGDLQGATPVLLVRPAVAPIPAEVTGEEPVETSDVGEGSAATPIDEPAPEVVEAEAGADEPAPEVVEAEAGADEASETLVVEEELPPVVEALSVDETPAAPVVDGPDGDDSQPEAGAPAAVQEESEPDESLVAVIEGLEAEEPTTDLKEALRRTTESLEAEGIVAPESIGPAEVESDSREESEEASAQPSWPWATQEQSKTFDLDALEEPGDDDSSLVRAPGDDETMAVARPVILGSYEVSEQAPPSDVDALLADLPVVEEAGSPPIPVPPPLPVETEEPAAPENLAADSGQSEAEVVAASMGEIGAAAEVAPASDFVDLPAVPSDPIDQMTCDDCVYTSTCPNKGQRDPATCGSFQWK